MRAKLLALLALLASAGAVLAADTFTTNYSFTKIEVGTSASTWGGKTNSNWDSVDTNLKAVSTVANTAATNASSAVTTAGNALPKAGGTMTGALTLYTSSPATALEAASKGYVDGITTLLAPKASPSFTGTAAFASVPTIGGLGFELSLPAFTGDAGSGGAKGVVPAPAAGDAAANKFLKASGAWTTIAADTSKKVWQVVQSATGAVATGTTVIPYDDTIPQQTEGDQYMSVTITPSNVASTLIVDVEAYVTHTAAGSNMICALFQDSNANALKVAAQQGANASPRMLSLKHVMTAGVTSATTFKVRCGSDTAGTLTFNGTAGGRIFGGAYGSLISVMETTP